MTSIVSSGAVTAGPLAPLRGLPARIPLALALVALGDWLWRGPSGSALLLFVAALALAAALANPWRADPRTLVLAGAGLLFGALPLVDDAGVFPLAFAFAGLAVFALLLTGQGTPGWLRRPLDVVLFYLSGPKRVLGDALAMSHTVRHGNWGRYFSASHLAGWIVPLGLLGVFLLLFAGANPLVERWLASADPGIWLNRVEPGRALLWAALLAFVWPFLWVRLAPSAWNAALKAILPLAAAQPPAPPAQVNEQAASSVPSVPSSPPIPLSEILFGREAIARSLVLFNLLFAVQTGLDAIYLWGGVELPDGMTYAAYAHRGAYPLIATALLAAAFVLAAMRLGGPAEGSALLRGLVYLFVAQNVALVLSSILRLDLYVSVYSLTYWRVAAFVWMGLVAVGLVLIGIRIALGQSNRWLVGANLIAATATLYACCFVNFAALIAEFNQEHQAASQKLDLVYLVSLGPQAIPAIDRALAATSDDTAIFYRDGGVSRRAWLLKARRNLAAWHEAEMRDWRAWTLRKARLSTYLAARPAPVLEPGGATGAPASTRKPPDATPAPVEPAPSPR